MRVRKLCFVLMSSCLLAATSFADTYQLRTIGVGGAQGFVGLSDAGTVVYARGTPCPNQGSTSGPCYVSFYIDGTETFSATRPSFPYMAASAHTSITNGAFSVSVDRPNDSGLTVTTPRGVQVLSSMTTFGYDTLWNLDSMGDFTVCDCVSNEYFEAIDLTTRQAPEPGGLLLAGTGLVSVLGALRRRLR